MSIEHEYELSTDSAGCQEIRITNNGIDVVVEYEYGANLNSFVETIRFSHVIAQRFVTEDYAQIDSTAYDSIVRVEDSSWREELKALESEGSEVLLAGDSIHYSVTFSNCGQLDVLASGFEVISNKPGTIRSDA